MPDNAVNIFKYNKDLMGDTVRRVISNRRMERVQSLGDLIKEMEAHLLIFPDRKGIKHFHNIVHNLRHSVRYFDLLLATPGKIAYLVFSPEFYAEVVKLTTRLEPRPSSSTRVPDSCPLQPVSEAMMRVLVPGLTSPGSGQDWQRFILGLGRGLPQEDHIRLRHGDIDNLERQCRRNYPQIIRERTIEINIPMRHGNVKMK